VQALVIELYMAIAHADPGRLSSSLTDPIIRRAQWPKSTILVTGGAGFIGSHVCEALTGGRGVAVRCFDNLATGKRLENVAHLEGQRRLHASLTGDLRVHADQLRGGRSKACTRL
jgi:hypothetical protein